MRPRSRRQFSTYVNLRSSWCRSACLCDIISYPSNFASPICRLCRGSGFNHHLISRLHSRADGLDRTRRHDGQTGQNLTADLPDQKRVACLVGARQLFALSSGGRADHLPQRLGVAELRSLNGLPYAVARGFVAQRGASECRYALGQDHNAIDGRLHHAHGHTAYAIGGA